MSWNRHQIKPFARFSSKCLRQTAPYSSDAVSGSSTALDLRGAQDVVDLCHGLVKNELCSRAHATCRTAGYDVLCRHDQMLGLIQLLLIFSFIVLTTMPVAFVVFGCRYLLTGKHGRDVLITGVFLVGALGGGFVVWQLVPAEWTLSFWRTLKATVDTEKYGHAVEHYAEGVVMMITFAALLGGIASAGVAALGARLLSKFAHT